MLIRGVEVSSKEVVDHTGSPRQHVLLGRTERDMGTDRTGSTAQRYVVFDPVFLLQVVVENVVVRLSALEAALGLKTPTASPLNKFL